MTLSKTGAGLAKWAEDIHRAKTHVYWYGTYCKPCTDDLLAGKTRQYPEHYAEKRQATYRKHIQQGKIATDCNGLIEGYAWEENGVVKRNRNDVPDRSASGMYSAARYKGKIADGLPEIPGLLVWTKTKAHVAVYVGNGYVVEARDFSHGLQRNAMSKRSFVYWGDYAYIDYAAEEFAKMKAAAGGTSSSSTTESKPASGTPTIRKGSKGDAVREMQNLLIKAGCKLPKYGADGHCGDETVAAIKAFQTANSLTPDGICGALTWAKLKATPGSEAQKPEEVKPTTNRPTIRKGRTGEVVREMQTLLVKAGCSLPLYGIDGNCGDETVAAIKAFQTANSLTPDGICGALTWAKLDKV